MTIVYEKINSPNVLVRELDKVNGGIMLSKVLLDGEISGGKLHPLILDLSEASFIEAFKKAYEETATGFGNVPFGVLVKKDELMQSPCPLYEHDLLLWFE